MVVMPFKIQGRVQPQKRGWNNQEFAEFYRIKGLLDRAGLVVDVDHGLSDEGDPWFVFLRQEGEEVLAHFARIDNDFVAISAIKQEIYKGNNIRGVVEQMLNRHPMILSMDRKNEKLFLHPSAALTAFITAAFILSLDEAKANSWSEIIEAVVQNNDMRDGNVVSHVSKTPNGPYPELLALLNVDSSSQGYQIAILGAALIASELSSNSETSGPSDHIALYQSEQKGDASEGENELKDAANSYLHQKNLRIDDFQDGYTNSEEHEVSNNSSNHLSSSIVDYSKELDHGDPILWSLTENSYDHYHRGSGDQYVSLDGISVPGGEIGINANSVSEFLSNNSVELSPKVQEISKDPGRENTILVSLAESAYQVFEKATNKQDASLDSIGIAVDSTGELLVLTMSSAIEDSLSNGSDLLLSTGHIDHSLSGRFEVQKTSGNFSAGNEIASFEVEPSAPVSITPKQFPILGHSLTDHDGGLLQLSNSAIDVVFYDGGNVRVKDFELGKDLLWFFLDGDQLQRSQSEIVDNTDLVLTFDDVDVLTFVDVFESRPDIEMI